MLAEEQTVREESCQVQSEFTLVVYHQQHTGQSRNQSKNGEKKRGKAHDIKWQVTNLKGTVWFNLTWRNEGRLSYA